METHKKTDPISMFLGYACGLIFVFWIGYEVYLNIDFNNKKIHSTAIIIGEEADGTGNPLVVVKYSIGGKEYVSNDYMDAIVPFEIGDTVKIHYYKKNFTHIVIDW